MLCNKVEQVARLLGEPHTILTLLPLCHQKGKYQLYFLSVYRYDCELDDTIFATCNRWENSPRAESGCRLPLVGGRSGTTSTEVTCLRC